MISRNANTQLTREISFGFSLVEQLITMSIVMIIIAAAVPSFRPITQQAQNNASLQHWMSDFAFAKLEAHRLGGQTIICPSQDGQRCNAGNTSVEWGRGWIIYFDQNSNGSLDNDERVLRRSNKLSKTVSLSSDNNINTVSFDQFGLARINNTETGVLRLYTVNQTKPEYCIHMGNTSQPRIIQYGQQGCL